MTSAKPKAAPKAGAKKKPAAPRPAGPGALAAGGGVTGALAKAESTSTSEPAVAGTRTPVGEVESFSARGLDGALELMDAVTTKTDKESRGQAAAGLEKHPEVRDSRY